MTPCVQFLIAVFNLILPNSFPVSPKQPSLDVAPFWWAGFHLAELSMIALFVWNYRYRILPHITINRKKCRVITDKRSGLFWMDCIIFSAIQFRHRTNLSHPRSHDDGWDNCHDGEEMGQGYRIKLISGQRRVNGPSCVRSNSHYGIFR